MTTSDATTTYETSSTPTAPAPQSAAPAITPEIQALIEAARAEGRNSGAAETRRAFEAKQRQPSAAPAPQPRTETPPEPQAHPDPLAILKLRDDFDDATADLQLAAPQRRFLREQVMATRPPDVAAFVRGFVDVWGSKPAAPAATTNVTNPAPTTSAQPATAMLGTTPPATVTADTPLTSLGKTDLDAAIRRLGPHEFSKRWMSELAASGKRIPIR